jgi:anti-sigma factor RsiW
MGQLFASDCDAVRGHVSAALDGELSEVENARVTAHLASCSDCRAFSADLRATTDLLRTSELEELGFPIVLPSRRLAIARRVQVGAAAAGLAVMVAVSALVGGLASNNSSGLSRARTSPAESASLRFPENELRMLQQAATTRQNLNIHARLTL